MPQRPTTPRVMLLIETSRSYGRGLVEGIGRYVSLHGPWSIYFEERGLHDPLPRALDRWHGDGIISRTVCQADTDRLLATGLPVVELYADPALGLPNVFADRKHVTELAVRHFLDRGLRHVGFFATDSAWWVQRRLEAFVEVAREHGLPCEVLAPAAAGGRRRAVGERQMAEWVGALPKPCGVYCPCDSFALPLMNVCRDVGVAVPDQVAVLGSDNDAVICAVTHPPLSSVSLGPERIGYAAAALLERMMHGGELPEKGVRVEPEGVVTRQSTDILALDDAEIGQAVRMIREHACRGLKVDDVAAALAMSRRALEQRFRCALDRTPKDEISRVRLERAQQFLRETTMPIEQVAQMSGFRTVEYFSRVFRAYLRVTPRAYRAARQNPCIAPPRAEPCA